MAYLTVRSKLNKTGGFGDMIKTFMGDNIVFGRGVVVAHHPEEAPPEI